MEAFTLLGGIKLVIDFFDGNWTGMATGILLPVPASELFTLGDSIYYLFDIHGNRIGTKDVSYLVEIPEHKVQLLNKSQVLIGYQKAKMQIGFSSDGSDNISFNKDF